MTKKILLLTVALAGLVSCTPKIFNQSGLRPTTSAKMHRSNLMPVFDEYEAARYYSAQVDFKDKSITGVLALSREAQDPRKFRLIMMTTFGIPIFDFSVSQDSFVVNSCMEQLNKKVVMKILERDFKSLLMVDVPEDFPGTIYMPLKGQTRWGYSVSTKEGGNYYMFYYKDNGIVHVLQNGSFLKKMNAVFDEQVITIEHPKLGLKMVLTLMPQTL
ncbi:MAG: hypothetical protein J6T67_10810 [Paludibacteraceae bacterium]|nr:hypothetical protein [Paludibacteraceae bacterium]MBR5373941.1 hypothetical protein [Paludibacteraceae bacterium]